MYTTEVLTLGSVLKGYDSVCTLYPYVPSLSLWRAWECAAYNKFKLLGRILDLGSGDGRFFSFLWPGATDVVAVEMDPGVADVALRSGVYRTVHVVPAHKVPEASESFDHVFANCSLEHMDHLDQVLVEIFRCLKPGGTLLCSVVTHRFKQWALLPLLVSMAGYENAAVAIREDFRSYHHLVNPLPTEDWVVAFTASGLVVQYCIPIVPKHSFGLFSFLDNMWHTKQNSGREIGEEMFRFLSQNPSFPSAFRHIVHGLLHMENNWIDSSGAVFQVCKPRTP